MNNNEIYEEIPSSVFCNDCMCDVPTDPFGEPACKQCNPQYDPELRDEHGNIKELDFHDVGLGVFDTENPSW